MAKSVKQVLLEALQGDKANLQFLHECMSNIKQRRNPACSEISFLTDAINPGNVARHDGMVGYVLWIDRETLRKIENEPPELEQQESPTDTYRQIENDGWIEWKGGQCPVKDGAIVDVRLRSGQAKFFCASEALIWANGNYVRDEMDCDIIAYRVIENDGREGC
ncbi:hypothetical protein ACIP6T_09830 [Pantoea sp. NPDC088449]|uniref:hypothetical protein n=1 Tax=Pantoea sp. NPDC088449 TaxID=3364392 RepID=UPI0038013C96